MPTLTFLIDLQRLYTRGRVMSIRPLTYRVLRLLACSDCTQVFILSARINRWRLLSGSIPPSIPSTMPTAPRLSCTKPFAGSFSSNSNLRHQLAPLLDTVPCETNTRSFHIPIPSPFERASTVHHNSQCLPLLCCIPSSTSWIHYTNISTWCSVSPSQLDNAHSEMSIFQTSCYTNGKSMNGKLLTILYLLHKRVAVQNHIVNGTSVPPSYGTLVSQIELTAAAPPLLIPETSTLSCLKIYHHSILCRQEFSPHSICWIRHNFVQVGSSRKSTHQTYHIWHGSRICQ